MNPATFHISGEHCVLRERAAQGRWRNNPPVLRVQLDLVHSVDPPDRNNVLQSTTRNQNFEALDQHHAPIHPSPLRKKSPSSPGGEIQPSRPVIHAPIPCHPKRMKGGPVSLPWPSDWVSVAAAGTGHTLPTSSSRLHLPHFPSLIPPSLPATPRRHTVGSPWQKPSTPLPPKEPTVVFTLRRMPDNTENETRPNEKKEDSPSIAQKISGEAPRDSCDGPLDLSDHTKSKPNQPANYDSPIALQCQGGIQRSPDRNVNMLIPVSSPSLVAPPSSSSTTQVKQQEEPTNDHNHEVKDQQQKEEAVGKTEQSNKKKVPVLTLLLRPVPLSVHWFILRFPRYFNSPVLVVGYWFLLSCTLISISLFVTWLIPAPCLMPYLCSLASPFSVVRLETLTSALHKQESTSSNSKPKCPSIVSPHASSASSQSSCSTNEAESSPDEQEDKSGSGQESKPNCKRKRPRVETKTDRDSDTNS
ncbi:hypothetical protein CRENBAI_021878 [Crenichthys baileyi]|uniref:Uncharacterized protein n=1 Tax=Crenichthys baileyi TaxID=28760 RepID=A0AAV9SSA3_9TELE